MNSLCSMALLLALSTVVLTGLSCCASKPKSYIVLLESHDGTTGMVLV